MLFFEKLYLHITSSKWLEGLLDSVNDLKDSEDDSKVTAVPKVEWYFGVFFRKKLND